MQKNNHFFYAFLLFCLFSAGLLLPVEHAQAYNFNSNIMAISAKPSNCGTANPPSDLTLCTRQYTGNVCPIDYQSDLNDYNNTARGNPTVVNRQTFGLTKRIVICTKETILYAVYAVLVPFSDFLGKTIAAAITLAVVLWGAAVAMGRKDVSVQTSLFITAIKIGAVVIFTANFGYDAFDPQDQHGGFFGLLLDGVEGILAVVTNYISFSTVLQCPNVVSTGSNVVWERVDCVLENIVGGVIPISGKTPTYTLLFGIVGFLITALLSGTVGVFIALLGFYLILKFLMAIIRATYIFIMSYTAFALMVLISPMIIPLILFKATKGYFEKWLQLSISFILQPIFLFAYLAMLVAAFDTIVFTGPSSLFRAITGTQMNGKIIGYPPPASNPNNYFQFGDALVNASITTQTGQKYVYTDDTQGEVAIKIDPDQVKKDLKLKTVDTGVVGVLGEFLTDQANWDNPNGIFGFLNQSGKSFFKVDVKTKKIDWDVLAEWGGEACVNSSGPVVCSTTTYLVKIILAFIMAVITAYIFVSMLDYLPFIGSGLVSDSASLPVFGANTRDHKAGMPGDSLLGGLKNKIGAKFGLGRS